MNKQVKKIEAEVLSEEDIFDMHVEWVSDGIPYNILVQGRRGISGERTCTYLR